MKDNTVYMVSGYMRTGTSMMMRALEAGGLEAVTRASRDDFRKQYADDAYDPNEGGLYELENADYRAPGFPRPYQGKLLKCLMAGTNQMATVPKLRVVFMRRDYEEVRQSFLAFFDAELRESEESFLRRIDMAIENLQNRKDTEVDVLWYRDVVADPFGSFERLRVNGWPIEPAKAAAIVDPNLLRFKREELAIGIV